MTGCYAISEFTMVTIGAASSAPQLSPALQWSQNSHSGAAQMTTLTTGSASVSAGVRAGWPAWSITLRHQRLDAYVV
jgi:hypothetical protein